MGCLAANRRSIFRWRRDDGLGGSRGTCQKPICARNATARTIGPTHLSGRSVFPEGPLPRAAADRSKYSVSVGFRFRVSIHFALRSRSGAFWRATLCCRCPLAAKLPRHSDAWQCAKAGEASRIFTKQVCRYRNYGRCRTRGARHQNVAVRLQPAKIIIKAPLSPNKSAIACL